MTNPATTDLRPLAETIFTLRFESMPAWVGPDRLAWLDDRTGVAHLVVGELSTGERRQLTQGTERMQSLHAIPGAGFAVAGTDLGGNERQQLLRVDLATGAQHALTRVPERMHEPFALSPHGDVLVYRTNDGASGEFSLYRMSLSDGEATCLWDDAGQVRAHAVDARGQVLASLLTSNLDADLWLIEADGERRPLLQIADESWVIDAAFVGDTHALVLTNAGSDMVGLRRIDLASGAMEVLIDGEFDLESIALAPDGKSLAWAENRDGYSVVRIADLDRLDAAIDASLPAGVADRLAWSPDGGRLAVGWTPVDRPGRVWLVERDGNASPAFGADDETAFTGRAPEVIRFPTFDGRQIPAFWFPADDPDAPVVIDVHGGPESQRRAAFHPVLQFLVASGFHVLSTNVRGSTGYGKAYSHLDDVDLRMDSVRDLEHAHAWVRGQLGDEARIAVMGQSYGGFMTLAAITEYPDLWYAAVDVVGIANFVTFLERTGPWRRRHRSAEYGSLERDRALLERISPIRKVDAITAPLLVIHGRNDPRVPLYEAEQLVASLEGRGRPVELIVYDDEGHGLAKRPNRIDGYTRAAAFLWEQTGSERA